jgi:hypothetical protein
MWVFTTFGFFSVVQHRGKPDRLLVRGRVRADVEALARRLVEPLQHTPNADYPYRVEVDRLDFATVMTEAVDGVDYDNFKNAVAEQQGAVRATVYHDVWQDLLLLQSRREFDGLGQTAARR